MLQYTTLEVVTGLTMVQGQLVMVKVVDYTRVSFDSFVFERISTRVEVSRGAPQYSPLSREAYSSGSVGDAVEGQLSGGWADGGIGSVNLSGIHNGAIVVGGDGGCESSDGGEGGELHLDGCLVLFTLKVIKVGE